MGLSLDFASCSFGLCFYCLCQDHAIFCCCCFCVSFFSFLPSIVDLQCAVSSAMSPRRTCTPSLLSLTPNPTQRLQVITEPRAELRVLESSCPPTIRCTHGREYLSVKPSEFIQPSPPVHASLSPFLPSKRVRLHRFLDSTCTH